MGHNARVTRRRSLAIFGLKLVHSLIFLTVSTSILHVFYAGVRNRPSRLTRWALGFALGECAVFVVNRGTCPITDVTRWLGAENARVSDIFLPRWFADRIPQIYTPPLLVGVLALLYHHWRDSSPRQLAA